MVRELAGAEYVLVAAPAHDLWTLRWDFTRLGEYNPQVSSLRQTTTAAAGRAGARFEFALLTPGAQSHVVLEVTECITDRLVATAMRGALSADERFWVTALGPRLCAGSLHLWLDLPQGLEEHRRRPLLEGARLQIRRELDAMRALLEGGSAPPEAGAARGEGAGGVR